jgi:hypothetical protein
LLLDSSLNKGGCKVNYPVKIKVGNQEETDKLMLVAEIGKRYKGGIL